MTIEPKSAKDIRRILAALCDREQPALRHQIALDQPSFSEEQITDAQVEIMNWLENRPDQRRRRVEYKAS